MKDFFENLGNLGNLQQVFSQAQKIQSEMGKLQEEIQKKEVQATSGGGMVTVTANGGMQIVSLKIDRTVVDPNDVEMLQDLIQAASNEALRKAKELLKSEMAKLTGGIPIPGMGG